MTYYSSDTIGAAVRRRGGFIGVTIATDGSCNERSRHTKILISINRAAAELSHLKGVLGVNRSFFIEPFYAVRFDLCRMQLVRRGYSLCCNFLAKYVGTRIFGYTDFDMMILKYEPWYARLLR